MSHEKPYAGLRVVDISQGIAGPYCGMLLAQYGADVIKVEPPEGDWARVLGPRYGSHTAFSIIGNLGKRSLVLDLKQAEGKDRLRRLVRTADVFMEGFRPGVAARLGFSYDAVRALAPVCRLCLGVGFRAGRAVERQAGHGPGAAGVHRLHARQQGP